MSADTVERLAAFRQAHAGAKFETHNGAWYAYNPVTRSLVGALYPNGQAVKYTPSAAFLAMVTT
ncbi:MAG TPA: hypothetical protein VD866_08130 [Urbifossiella sp.]|nr:hypothetical protein [Urbifossiella sp.]